MKTKQFKVVRIEQPKCWISQRADDEAPSFGEATPSLSARVLWNEDPVWLQVDYFPGIDMFVVNASNKVVQQMWMLFTQETKLDTYKSLGTSAWDLCEKFAEFVDNTVETLESTVKFAECVVPGSTED